MLFGVLYESGLLAYLLIWLRLKLWAFHRHCLICYLVCSFVSVQICIRVYFLYWFSKLKFIGKLQESPILSSFHLLTILIFGTLASLEDPLGVFAKGYLYLKSTRYKKKCLNHIGVLFGVLLWIWFMYLFMIKNAFTDSKRVIATPFFSLLTFMMIQISTDISCCLVI